MRLIKLAFVITASTVFILSCQQTENTNQTSNVNASMTATSSSSTAVLTTLPTEAQSASASLSPAASPTISPKASPTASPTPRRTPSPTPSTVVDIASARTIYQRNCAACHGRSGEGNSNGAPGLKGLARTDQQLTGKIANGGSGMPAYKGNLTQHQITGLVRLIRQGL